MNKEPTACYDFLKGRGLTDEIINYFQFAGDPAGLAIPVHNVHGKFVNYVIRKLDNSEPKYDFSLVPKSNYVFNLHRALADRRKAVIVVEGFFGAIALHMAGYKSVVALMGSAMSTNQEMYITRWWPHVILMMDGDIPGRKAQEEHFRRFRQRDLIDVYKINLNTNLQPDDLTETQLKRLFSAQISL